MEQQVDLSVEIAGVTFSNPVIAASGTFGYGKEYAGMLDIGALGGICTKGLTLRPRQGNEGARIYETPAGLLNSIGLENPGIPAFIENELPGLKALGPNVIANLSGSTAAEYAEGAALLAEAGVDMIEVNISCPNVKAGGLAFGMDCESAALVTRSVRKAAPAVPLMVKLSPNAPDLCGIALACVNAGADALSLVNTFKAMAIDIDTLKPVFENIHAGLSGPCIHPIALRMVWEVYEALGRGSLPRVPLVGIGGIANARDAIEFLAAGAAAVEIGAATFAHPRAMTEVIAGIAAYLKEKNFSTVPDLTAHCRT
ncbi:MAG: dihydroorotate dehydrogenase [Treponema sp.]|jgi:dihydroorotate dehydrogenase (NAD+) catalytic subunit|nr:dihydroorotate dehydrogenase [Treponema sp.]